MATSFYFYDLETSGINPRDGRIMQFAGQRTDENLQPIGEPHNVLVKLTDEILPEPDAVLITGITPQQTVADGLTEAAFLQLFYQEIATPDTIFVGYNTVRFDDEFMRFMMWRNFYDAYAWQWQDGRSRWDLLDVVRMTRALRPEGIVWPVTPDGKPTNRLELLTSVNKLDHAAAHDALSDVQATIAMARLIRDKQPKLFDYLLSTRSKQAVQQLVQKLTPFVYTSGKYAAEFEKTTVAVKMADHPQRKAALVYDLRHNPTEFLELSPAELAERWRWTRDKDAPNRLPVKTLQYNRCPAVAPLGVLDVASRARLQIDQKQIDGNHQKLQAHPTFVNNLLKAVELLNTEQQARQASQPHDVDTALYDGFIGDVDKSSMQKVQHAQTDAAIADVSVSFKDQRLAALLPLYKARNFPKALTDEERSTWEAFRTTRLTSGGSCSRAARYFERLAVLAGDASLDKQKQFLLEELQLWGQSILPYTDEG